MMLNKKMRPPIFGLFIAIILGSVMRLYHLDSKSLWSDELYSASIARYFPLLPQAESEWFRSTDIHHVSDVDTFWTAKATELSPPLFELITKLTVNLFGPNEIAMRMPSALASILMLFWIALQAWKKRGCEEFYVFFWVVLLSAISATYIQYAQEARPYSLGIFFSAILCINWYQRWSDGIDKAEIPKWGEITVFVLACYTHYYLLCLCAILLAGYFWIALRRLEWKSLLKLSIVPLVCTPWIALNFHTLLPGSYGAFAYAPAMGRLESIDTALQMTGQIVGAATVFAVAIMTYFLMGKKIFTETINNLPSVFKAAFAMLSVSMLYLLVISQLEMKSGLFHSRHFVFILPALYVLIGVLLSHFARHLWVAIATIIILVTTQIIPIRSYYNTPKEGYRDAVAWLTPKMGQGAIIVTGWNTNRYFFKFYLDQEKNTFQQRSISSPAEADIICKDLQKNKEFGVIAHIVHKGMVDALASSCSVNFELIETGVIYGMVAQRWKNKNSQFTM